MLHRFHRATPGEGLRPFLRRITPAITGSKKNDARLRKAARYVDAICAWLPYLGSESCVARSLTLYRVARSTGHQAVWSCGVRKTEAGALDGHAWIELDGEPYLEPDGRAADYAVTFRYPEDPVTTGAQAPPRKSPS
jgi:hypothetical protein